MIKFNMQESLQGFRKGETSGDWRGAGLPVDQNGQFFVQFLAARILIGKSGQFHLTGSFTAAFCTRLFCKSMENEQK